MTLNSECNYAVVVPCYNEGMTIIKFLTELEGVLDGINKSFRVVVVDDYSIDNTRDLLNDFCNKEHNQQISVLALPYNTGHQKSIQQGLLYCYNHLHAEYVIVMDGDGEDDPAAIKELINYEGYDYVPVIRGKRNENWVFKSLYKIYKMMFALLIGKEMNFGNYCVIRKNMVQNICDSNFVHLAGFLSKQKCKKKSIVWDRRKRIDGKSKMNFTNLLWHGFHSFVEYAEDFLLFFLRIFGTILIFFFALITNVLYKKLISHEAIPGWASTLTVSLMIGALLCFGFLAIGVILISLSAKNTQSGIKPIYKVME